MRHSNSGKRGVSTWHGDWRHSPMCSTGIDLEESSGLCGGCFRFAPDAGQSGLDLLLEAADPFASMNRRRSASFFQAASEA
jgi:hypothetical protein